MSEIFCPTAVVHNPIYAHNNVLAGDSCIYFCSKSLSFMFTLSQLQKIKEFKLLDRKFTLELNCMYVNMYVYMFSITLVNGHI